MNHYASQICICEAFCLPSFIFQYLLIVSCLALGYIFLRVLIEFFLASQGVEVIGLTVIFRSGLRSFVSDFHATDGIFQRFVHDSLLSLLFNVTIAVLLFPMEGNKRQLTYVLEYLMLLKRFQIDSLFFPN
jgi:hypothetical protein